MLGLNPWVILGVVLAFLGFGAASYIKGHSDGVDTTTLAYETSLAKQRDEATAALIKSKDDARAKEIALQKHNDEVEAENVEKNAKLNGLRIANGRLVAAAGGLFDNNGRPRGQGRNDNVPGSPGTPAGSEGAGPGCGLSATVTDDLLNLARDADAAAIYGQTCHAYAVGPR